MGGNTEKNKSTFADFLDRKEMKMIGNNHLEVNQGTMSEMIQHWVEFHFLDDKPTVVSVHAVGDMFRIILLSENEEPQ